MGVALPGLEEWSRYVGVDLYTIARHRFRPGAHEANIGEHMPLRCMADAWFGEELAHFQGLIWVQIDGHNLNQLDVCDQCVGETHSRILRFIGGLLRQ